MSHPFVHVEISANNRKEAADFYAGVFGWEMKDYPDMNYTTFETGHGPGGGFNPVTDTNPAGKILIYIDTDDLEATMAAIEKHGGKILSPKFEIPTVGWMATFSDPTGNVLALLQPVEGSM
jgi:predicted enzyme related to lactoylglutathione lyase